MQNTHLMLVSDLCVSELFPREPRELIFGYVIVFGDDTEELEKLRDRSLETTAMSPRSLQRSETNLKPSFCINSRALYLASETT